MLQTHNVRVLDENESQKLIDLISRNYYLFIFGVLISIIVVFLINRYSIPTYEVSASILIKDEQPNNMDDIINANFFGTSQNLQNELLLIQSAPVISQAIKNLDLPVMYYRRVGLQYLDNYRNSPFKVLYMSNHSQPIGVRFEIVFEKNNVISIRSEGERVSFYNYEQNKFSVPKEEWKFAKRGKVGELFESPDLSFIIELDSTKTIDFERDNKFYFEFISIPQLTDFLKSQLEFNTLDKDASAIQITFKTNSLEKGIDIVNSITDVYSKMNLEKKNHLAAITIDYIEEQLNKISDSLNRTEQSLQSFRAVNQLLNITEQSSGISSQYRDLENRLAELITKKRYYIYVSDYLDKNDDFSSMTFPASLGIQDQLLNNLMGELVNAQTQKSNLIENKQEKNPLVKKLSIQIDNLKKTISENISYVLKTIEISIDDLNKRIEKIEAEISRMPNTERRLTGIERKYRLNETIYNYLMQKRAEANITKASNLPGNEIIEEAKCVGNGPVAPNKKLNYFIGLFLGLAIPFGYLQLKSAFSQKIDNQEFIERITDIPILGKILHNHHKTKNVVFDYPNSSISESFRALRTNLEYYVRGGSKKVILVTSCIEGEGKSFNALNIAMSYAQFNRRTILLDFDLRKQNHYFKKDGEDLLGLSSYLINKAVLEDIIIKSPHEKLDYISSGPIPPNPVELIGLEKTEKLISQLKQDYDYIIIDTPPLAQVTDGYLLIDYADVKVIITRHNFSIKRVLAFILRDLRQKNIGNLCIVFNDNRYYKEQYGYGYGYKKKNS